MRMQSSVRSPSALSRNVVAQGPQPYRSTYLQMMGPRGWTQPMRFAALVLAATTAAGCGAAASHHTKAARGPVADNTEGFIVDAGTGRHLSDVRANGWIDAAVPDGSGGWYIAGSFTLVNDEQRHGLAHVAADGTLDTSWHPTVEGFMPRDIGVTALARGFDLLYLGGHFSHVDGVPREGLAAISLKTGEVARAWQPPNAGTWAVTGLTLVDKRVLISGSFSWPLPGSALAALDATTGRVDSGWTARIAGIPGDGGNGVNSVAVSGRRLFVGGNFRTVSGAPRNGLAALDAATGALDETWDPKVLGDPNSSRFSNVLAIVATNLRVFVSGDFSSVDGVSVPRFAALTASTGTVDRGWNSNGGGTNTIGSASVLTMAPYRQRLYLGGDFTTFAVAERHGFAAVSESTGKLTEAFDSQAPTSVVLTLSVSGSRLFVGGRFHG